ncbi:thrombospondin type 3 repeat-containing protein [Luteolibacter arcticus]|uniref:Thrombospondin type 3 repeat-containing protein n=1 Tax=Luteolibacter arcticus TaxID=1581411 RepID=A0ABT3GI04_9BACT|nr:thrombospondin type 3 repeat-containing protein [Luteolibacter arcticus]MCW1923129.1 thrombospondin type 3 repeat-containing protein [Luteolibacter arcticus]
MIFTNTGGPTDGNPAEVNYIGYFTISSSGALSFTRAATVPGNSDSDGDGFSDADEAIAGTNPNSGSSFFRLPAPVVVPGVSKSFSLPTVAGRTYVIEYNDDLLGTWIQVGTTAGTGSVWNLVDNDAGRNALPRGFYRARVTNP